jgi:hypothetical protein
VEQRSKNRQGVVSGVATKQTVQDVQYTLPSVQARGTRNSDLRIDRVSSIAYILKKKGSGCLFLFLSARAIFQLSGGSYNYW